MTTMAMVVIGQREARPASEGIAHGANDEQDQRLGRQRLDEPAGVKQLLGSAKEMQQGVKGRKIVERADRPDVDHKIANELDVPAARL